MVVPTVSCGAFLRVFRNVFSQFVVFNKKQHAPCKILFVPRLEELNLRFVEVIFVDHSVRGEYWDVNKEELLVARDRMGVKGIYYALEKGTLYLASEIRPILAANAFAREIDPVSLNLFLRYRYTPAPLTIFKGIKKLVSGTYLKVKAGRTEVIRYDNFTPMPFEPMPSIDEAQEQLLALYRQAVKRQIRSDVPLGLLLSGGIDSGLLLGLMNENGDDWNTYTVGFGAGTRNDELDDAAETARVLGAPNTGILLERDAYEEAMASMISNVEEPIATQSVVPLYYVCQRAREDVKVALCGQGPDELFGGYKRHLGLRYGGYWRALPSWIRDPMRSVLSAMPRNDDIRRALYSLDVSDRNKRFQQVFSIMRGDQIDSLFQDGVLPENAGDQILECWRGILPLIEHTDELGAFNFVEVRSSLPDELLMCADKMSMAHGLELRVPYLDQDVVEYVERLNASFKVRRGSRKYLHRKVCKNYLPDEIVNRKKRGFEVDVDGWFRNSLSKKLDETLLDKSSQMYDLMRYDAVESLVQEHKQGKKNNSKILFSLVVYEEWNRTFLAKGG